RGVERGAAEYIAEKVSLPDGFARLSRVAIVKIIDQLMNGWDEESDKPLTYDQAVVRAGYASHSQFHSGELFDELPYYGAVLKNHTQDIAIRESPHVKAATNPDEWEFGKIANPTVHIGLNQVRVVVNVLVKEYGLPAQIHVEIGRDLGQGAEGRNEDSRRRAQNERENDLLRKALREEFNGQRDTYANRTRLRLFNELGALNQRCVLTN